MPISNNDNLIEQEFQLEKGLFYLNHAAVSPWPKRTRDIVTAFAEENFSLGSWHYPRWLKVETSLRNKIQTLINAPSADDIALIKNTSEALSFVAYGLSWNAGDNIVITNQEFPSNHIVWRSLESQGVELRIAPIDSYQDDKPELSLFELCDASTRMIAVSSIQYGSGLKMDLNNIGEFCRANNILFLIDAIQSIGAVNFDVQAYKANFVMADGHKWMLGPEGMGFFYCDQEQRENLKLTQYGWHMIEEMGNYKSQSWEIAKSARRFECGSPNMIGIHALEASISLILQLGMDEIEQRVQANTELMLDAINESSQLELISPGSRQRLGGIVTFKHKTQPSDALYHYLMKQRILCAERGGGVRFSPHFYTNHSLIIKAINIANRM
jgi:selenocysteine lyase/cysteine desulfurase